MRNECRTCGTERKDGVGWYDENYCSGKCKKTDGGEIAPVPERVRNSGRVASLEDYLVDYPKNMGQKDRHGQRIKGRFPKLYRRRYEPERLNWGPPLSAPDLKQAGLRANRSPIPGDFDYDVEVEVEEQKNV